MQTAEEDFLVSVDEYCNEHFLKRLNADGGTDYVSNEEVASAVQMVMAGTQGVFVQKLNELQDTLVNLHNNQVEFANQLSDITNKQVNKLEQAESTTQKNTMVMKKAFDEIIKNLSSVSESLSGKKVGKKKKGWLW